MVRGIRDEMRNGWCGMTAPSSTCLTPTKCPSWTGKQCGHAVLYGVGACWKRDGIPVRKVGLQNEESPFAGKGEE